VVLAEHRHDGRREVVLQAGFFLLSTASILASSFPYKISFLLHKTGHLQPSFHSLTAPK
jgi:hypothetical protein